MNRRQYYGVLQCLLAVMLFLLSFTVVAKGFSFAAIGDVPYNSLEERQWGLLKRDIEGAPVSFLVHVGDIKSSVSRCLTRLYQKRLRQFQNFKKPLFYTFGDNEWTDCGSHNAGAYNTLTRLKILRDLFTKGDVSLGQPQLPLVRQSQLQDYKLYRENVRWFYNETYFVMLHIVGSNNNAKNGAQALAEYRARDKANLFWLKETFAIAKAQSAKSVVVVIHANPGFEYRRGDKRREGFENFMNALQDEVIAYEGHTLLLHGDTHDFRVDQPMRDRQGKPFLRFTRVETFGSPFVNWVEITIDHSLQSPFVVRPRLLNQGLGLRR